MEEYLTKMSKLLWWDAFERFPPTSERGSRTQGLIKYFDFKLRENAPLHHTDVFRLVTGHLKRPIFRRGQPFTFTIHFNRQFQLGGNKIRLDFNFGPNPLPGDGTKVMLIVTSQTRDFPPGPSWGVRIKQQTDMQLTLEVKPAPSSPVGVWFMTVVTNPGANGEESFNVPTHLYIIFNPFSKDDDVYMENEAMRKEYVMNNRGYVYQGNSTSQYAKEWHFNQFETVSLPTAVLRLEAMRMEMGRSARGDPVQVTRFLSLGKLLAGNWSGDYSGGRNPNYWKSSDEIFGIYMDTFEHVKFGQCWVYGATLCSLCRALGIPCRVVSNMPSGHDYGHNLAIDRYSIGGKDYGRDSIWNFHVWNDAWMARPDLPPGFGGWQAFDSTPQERSKDEPSGKSFSICGPASVEAIKRGEVGLNYDATFIYGEINADVVDWFRDQNGQDQIKRVDKTLLGQFILTKAVGQDTAVNLARNQVYKFPEDSTEERQALFYAAKIRGNVKHLAYQPKPWEDEVYIRMMPINSVLIGKALCVFVNLTNNTASDTVRTVNVTIRIDSIEYNGIVKKHLKIDGQDDRTGTYKKTLVMEPKQKELVKACVQPEVYLDNLGGFADMRIYAQAIVQETHQVWVDHDDVQIRKPKLILQMHEEVQKDSEFIVKVTFTNPLPRILNNCSFSGSANCKPNGSFDYKFRNVNPRETVNHDIKIKAVYAGGFSVVVQFNSDVLTNVTGSKTARCS